LGVDQWRQHAENRVQFHDIEVRDQKASRESLKINVIVGTVSGVVFLLLGLLLSHFFH
jgi:hypothetical protein